jgi:hypothetical protein
MSAADAAPAEAMSVAVAARITFFISKSLHISDEHKRNKA